MFNNAIENSRKLIKYHFYKCLLELYGVELKFVCIPIFIDNRLATMHWLATKLSLRVKVINHFMSVHVIIIYKQTYILYTP